MPSPFPGFPYASFTYDSIHMRLCMYASFAASKNFPFQIGSTVCLCDDNNKFLALDFSSRTLRRIVHWSMRCELYAFTNAFDSGFVIIPDMISAFKLSTTLIMCTDPNKFFNFTTRRKRLTEWRLAIDTRTVRDAYERSKIDGVELTCSTGNPPDANTKIESNRGCKTDFSTKRDKTLIQGSLVPTKDLSQ